MQNFLGTSQAVTTTPQQFSMETSLEIGRLNCHKSFKSNEEVPKLVSDINLILLSS